MTVRSAFDLLRLALGVAVTAALTVQAGEIRERHAGDGNSLWLVHIRIASTDDLPRLQEIEDDGDRLFDDVGIPVAAIAGSRPLSEYASYRPDRVLVAVDDADRPLGFALLDVVDGCAHLEQLAVAPAVQRRGIGSALVASSTAWARERLLPALTLCTYRDVPWNGPYYARLGFRELADGELTPGLLALRRRETELGLDVAPRMCMRLDLPAVQ